MAHEFKNAYRARAAAEDLIEKAEAVRSRYLHDQGWEYTSSTPGCYWMWCKVWRGKQWTYYKSDDALTAEAWMAEMGDITDGVLEDDRCPACKGAEFPGWKRGMRCSACDGNGTAGVQAGEPHRTDLSKTCPICGCAAHYICGHYRTVGVEGQSK